MNRRQTIGLNHESKLQVTMVFCPLQEYIYKTQKRVSVVNKLERGSTKCHLNEKAEEDQKGIKEVAV